MHTLVWDDGTGREIRAFYSDLDSASAQAEYEVARPGGSRVKHILNQDGIVVRAWTPIKADGTQHELTDRAFDSYATEVR